MIEKKLLSNFIQQNNLSGIVAFLNFIKEKDNLLNFYNFCKEQDPTLPNELPSNILFHGSQNLQSVLKPNNSIGENGEIEEGAYVYATDDPNYAIFLAILDLKDAAASVNATNENTELSINLDFVNGPSKLVDGYVHIVINNSFEKLTNREYQTEKEVSVLFTIQVTPQDLTVPICIKV